LLAGIGIAELGVGGSKSYSAFSEEAADKPVCPNSTRNFTLIRRILEASCFHSPPQSSSSHLASGCE
jgi:hypothetical protein